MKVEKKTAIVLTIAMLAVMATGCANKSDTISQNVEGVQSEQTKDVVSEQNATAETGDMSTAESKKTLADVTRENLNKRAVEVYMSFLNGDGYAYTSPIFDTDSTECEIYDYPMPQYSYRELVQATMNMNTGFFKTKYSFIDLGDDGTTEMVLRLENNEPSRLNSTVILHYDGTDLQMTYAYVDGFRTEATLFDTGHLLTGGSGGAGAYYTNYIGFDGDGRGHIISSENHFFSSYVIDVAYDLDIDYDQIPSDGFFGEYVDENFEVTEYIEYAPGGKTISFAIDEHAKGEEGEAAEKDFVDFVTSHGAIEITQEELARLTDGPQESEVEWTDFTDRGILYAAYFDMVTPEPEDYYYIELSTDEFCSPILLAPNNSVKDVKVMNLSFSYQDYYGTPCYDYEIIGTAEELTPQMPLIIYMTFMGDCFPTVGISYTDNTGNVVNQAIEQSGYDGTVQLTNIFLAN